AEAPRLFPPASAVSELGTCTESQISGVSLLVVFAATKEFVALNRCHHPDASFIARLGPLHAAQTAHAHRPGQGDLVRQRQQDLHRRPLFDVLRQEEIDSAGAYIAGFRVGFPNGCARGPSHGNRQSHGKTLGSAAFRPCQGEPPSSKDRVYPASAQGTIGLKAQNKTAL